MNIFLVYAHPEPRSLNGTLKRFMIDHLRSAGHAVRASDLHAMNWKATLDADDFSARNPAAPFDPTRDSGDAFATGRQPPDVAREQANLRWSDVVILQFPMWWFSMPAILKGWIDRVYANGFAYGVGEHSEERWGDRYGQGTLAGKRAMLVVTAGGWHSHYGPRGVNGPMEDLLFPIHHGVLYYSGFEVLPPFVVYKTGRMDAARLTELTIALGDRLDTLQTTPPLPFRPQNGGDYEIPSLTLREEIAPGRSGFGIHSIA
ncbi:NAD(P)H-dependent oxidoreductase [Variovorax soli]|uniref:NAD(P)H dehydrogenase (Quinone) n=1 Tax=Variovorax soli TaxID=376815 RepID=A0ABU1N8J7_9BURK|nr:NAD(P)H-dependent oxidoreductase [Variovorax soli]MDR6534688.1 NAD(P)H dehydrogenase (quinone) [Variovorax soli]